MTAADAVRRTTVRAAAKINLHLGVGPVRDDGFHPLATVYQAIGLYDDVTVADQDDWSVHVRAEARIDVLDVPTDETNLALRAARALAAHHDLDGAPGTPGARAARIEIHKGIPVAGGLAGGSADAAAALVALDRHWRLDTPDADLLALAATLGSDVPFALIGGTAAGTGRGELVDPLEDAGAWWWVVVESAEGLSTPAVYRRFDERAATAGAEVPDPEIPDDLLDALRTGDVRWLADVLRNDLADAALDLRPDLSRTFDDAVDVGGLAALLSGSGPTVLVLCSSRPHADEVRRGLLERGHERTSVAAAPVAGAHVVHLEAR